MSLNISNLSIQTPMEDELERVSTLSTPPSLKNIRNLVKNSIATQKAPTSADLKQVEIKSKTAEQLFQEDKLVVRAVSGDEVFSDLSYTGNFKLGAFHDEMNYLNGGEGLKNTSATLVVPNKNVSLYKDLGFLVNGETSEISHIYGIDSNSCADDNGKLQAASKKELLFDSLDDLAKAIKTTDLLATSTMNEVNGDFFCKDLVGLVARTPSNKSEDSSKNIKIRVIQKLIFKKHGVLLPIYKYNEKTGKLIKLETENCNNAIKAELAGASIADGEIRAFKGQIGEYLIGSM